MRSFSQILEKVRSFMEVSPVEIAALNIMARDEEYGVKSVKVFQNKVCIEIEEEGNLKTYVVGRQWQTDTSPMQTIVGNNDDNEE